MQRRFHKLLGQWLVIAALSIGSSMASGQGLNSLLTWQVKQVGTLPVVRCPDTPLAFTRQFHPFAGDTEKLNGSDLADQLADLIGRADKVLMSVRSSVESAVRLNFCLRRNEDRVVVQAMLQRHVPKCRASLSFVTGEQLHPGQQLAMDVVAVDYRIDARQRTLSRIQTVMPVDRSGEMRSLKPGRRIFISGQAVRDETTAAAAGKTMAQLGTTLEYLGLSWTNVVQVKSFLQPMASVEEVAGVIAKSFPTNDVPPQVFVEWTMKAPIEIELVVNGGKDDGKGPAVEYLTPPEMKASPVFTRVVRVNRGALVFTSSLYGPTDRGVENEVREIFRELDASMTAMGSDMMHLAKATYYVTSSESSRALGEIRPDVYDPKRPPAASKANVRGTGLPGHRINMDLIGVVK